MSISYPPYSGKNNPLDEGKVSPKVGESLPRIQTIGYRQPGAMEEIERLMQEDPTRILVDIRFSPRSQNIQWNKSAFSKKWEGRYRWMKELGNINYADPSKEIEILNAEEGIRQLFILHYPHSLILLCGCEEYESCHRKVVYDLLVEHIQAHTPNIPRNNSSVQVVPYTEQVETSEATCFLASDSHEEQEADPTEQPQKTRKPKASKTPYVQELEDKVAELEVKIMLSNPTMEKKAFEQLKEADQKIRSQAYTIDNQERQITTLMAEKKRQNLTEATCFSPSDSQIALEKQLHIAQQVAQNALEQADILHAENNQYRERDAKSQRIISRQRQQIQAIRQQVTARYHCSIQELLDGPAKMVPLSTYEKVQQELMIVEKLERNPKIKAGQISPIRKVIDLAINSPKRDDEGRARITAQKVARMAHVSDSTGERAIKFCETQLPDLFDGVRRSELAPNGEKTSIFYGRAKPEGLLNLALIEPVEYHKQGGDKTICAICGSKHVHIKKQTVSTIVCEKCGHESPPVETEPNITYSYPNSSYQKEDAEAYKKAKAQNQVDGIITNNKALTCIADISKFEDKITSYPPIVVDPDTSNGEQTITMAAELLFKLAGQDEAHITMPQRKRDSKYFKVKRELTVDDLRGHLNGAEAKGSLCRYSDGEARGLCFDADNGDDWAILQEAARLLTEVGIVVVLEESPSDRGGHMWVLFDGLVSAVAVRQVLYTFVPELEQIKEYWPANPEMKGQGNRVRLPGGYYHRWEDEDGEAIKGWCKMLNVATGEMSQDGQAGAALLLGALNVASLFVSQAEPQELAPGDAIIDADPQVQEVEAPKAEEAARATEPELSELEQKLGFRLPKVDAQWENDHGNILQTTLWFAIMPDYAANWYNERHTLEEIQSKERNGMALSPNGPERTASTTYHTTAQGERYTDFSSHGMRADGTRDTGDVLELAAKKEGISKKVLFSRIAREIVGKAKADLEAAARVGEPLPSWFEYPDCIITPRGRNEYKKTRADRKENATKDGRSAGRTNQLGAGINGVSKSSRNSIGVPERAGAEDPQKPGGVLVNRGGNTGIHRGEASISNAGSRDTGVPEGNNQSENDNRSYGSGTERGYQGDQTASVGGDTAQERLQSLAKTMQGVQSTHQDTGENDQSSGKADPGPSEEHRNTAEATQRSEGDVDTAIIKQLTGEFAEEDAKNKRELGTCRAVENHKTKKQCGSTRWVEVGEEGYICAKCYSPIVWSRK